MLRWRRDKIVGYKCLFGRTLGRALAPAPREALSNVFRKSFGFSRETTFSDELKTELFLENQSLAKWAVYNQFMPSLPREDLWGIRSRSLKPPHTWRSFLV